MNLGTFSKQPSEVFDYDITYGEWLTAGDNVPATPLPAVTVQPAGLTVDSIFVNDPVVKIWLSGGTNNTTYKVTVVMTSADGRVKEDEFKIKVKDI